MSFYILFRNDFSFIFQLVMCLWRWVILVNAAVLLLSILAFRNSSCTYITRLDIVVISSLKSVGSFSLQRGRKSKRSGRTVSSMIQSHLSRKIWEPQHRSVNSFRQHNKGPSEQVSMSTARRRLRAAGSTGRVAASKNGKSKTEVIWGAGKPI